MASISSVIAKLRAYRYLVALVMAFLELLIGLGDYSISNDVPITQLHFVIISLAAIIAGWPGMVLLSAAATGSYYLSNFLLPGKPLHAAAIPGTALTLLIFLLIGAAVLLIIHLLASLQQTNQVLSEKVNQIQATNLRLELLTRERERNRLARALHQGVIKTLLGVEYTASYLGRIVPADNLAAQKQARFIQTIAHSESEKVRDIILNLRTSLKTPLFQLVNTYLERWEQSYGIAGFLSLSGGDEHLEPALVYEVMAIVEEALENIARHSAATEARISLECTGPELRLVVEDNGQGLTGEVLEYLQPGSKGGTAQEGLLNFYRDSMGRLHFGLRGMCERAEALGGTFQTGSSAEGGLRITVTVPVTALLLK